jgi:putative ABC transport system permease protein
MENFFILERIIGNLTPSVGRANAILIVVGGCAGLVVLAIAAAALLFPQYSRFICKSLFRNVLRTAFTALATMVLVFVGILVWSVFVFLSLAVAEKSKDLKVAVSERWQMPSQMPFTYASTLEQGAAQKESDARPEDSMTWTFYGGSVDPTRNQRDSFIFFFALNPEKLRHTKDKPSLMEDIENLDQAYVEKLIADKRGCILGSDRLRALNKRIGETILVTGVNFKDINLELNIVGVLPEGRYNGGAFMHRDYLIDALDAYKRTHNGTAHPLANKSLNLVWLRLADQKTFQQVSDQIMNSSLYTAPPVKCETASAGTASFLDSYRDLINGMKYVLMPALLGTMALIIANAINISVRERRQEIAVLKVLGFRPRRILGLVLGEALLIGCGSGWLSAVISYVLVNGVLARIRFPISFFPSFNVAADSLWWGILFGGGTALLGSLWPAWSAGRVKVSEVFAKVT